MSPMTTRQASGNIIIMAEAQAIRQTARVGVIGHKILQA
jgi:hypothetical protein